MSSAKKNHKKDNKNNKWEVTHRKKNDPLFYSKNTS